jgi:hypothetical protein
MPVTIRVRARDRSQGVRVRVYVRVRVRVSNSIQRVDGSNFRVQLLDNIIL